MSEPNHDYPRYDKCAANACPLHSFYPDLPTCPVDAEIVCRLSKPKRLRIAARYPGVLLYGGLLRRPRSDCPEKQKKSDLWGHTEGHDESGTQTHSEQEPVK